MKSPATQRILVVDDNPAMLNVVRFNLTRSGLEVQSAINGLEAARLFDESPFDLVVTDLQMPEMSGEELCRYIRQQADATRTSILICSAKGLEVDCARMIVEYDIAHVMFKPFSPVEMVSIVKSILDKRSEVVLV